MDSFAVQSPLWARVTPTAPSMRSASDFEASRSDATTDGVWTIGDGSHAGFRCSASVLGHLTSLVGHSAELVGSVDVMAGTVAAGSFRIDLRSLRIFGKSTAGLDRMIDTTRYPAASFVIDKPIFLHASPRTNVTYRAPVFGSLTMHGITRPVNFAFIARYTGRALEATGSIAIAFSEWNLKAPFGIENNGMIEFTLRMTRSSPAADRDTPS